MASGARKPKRPIADSDLAALRSLPSVEVCLSAAQADPALAALTRDHLKTLIRRVLDELRRDRASLDAVTSSEEPLVTQIVRRARLADAAQAHSLDSIVNATGVVLHTNLGRAILAESAVEAMAQAGRSPINLEFDLDHGGRGDRDDLIRDSLCALTGAEDATVVNNNAAALLLVLNTLADGREVIVSRGELIEIGGSFRLPELMTRSGARLREVGTTNRTHPADYVNAIGPATALLLKVHPSNYQITGFTAAVELADLTRIARAHGLDVVEDLGAGALIDLGALGLPREPLVRERIEAGAALVTFSGDKLLGGPQAGIIAGRRHLVERCKRNPLWRALRCDKLRLAALAATLRLYQHRDVTTELPTLRILLRSAAELALLAERARVLLTERLGPPFVIAVVPSSAQIGSGSQPAARLESCALCITHPSLSAATIAAAFRRAKIIGRIHDDAFLLDLRALEDPELLSVSLSFNE
jgi:L-seryl-tRNA(Ser) seleniumtransferase